MYGWVPSLSPWNYHSLVNWLCVLVAHSCPTLWDPKDCSPPSSSFLGILQATILEWAATPFSRESFWPRDWTCVFCIAGRYFSLSELPGKHHPLTQYKIKSLKFGKKTKTVCVHFKEFTTGKSKCIPIVGYGSCDSSSNYLFHRGSGEETRGRKRMYNHWRAALLTVIGTILTSFYVSWALARLCFLSGVDGKVDGISKCLAGLGGWKQR